MHQFPWQRGQEATGHAAASQRVRITRPSAGANWGAVFILPVGTEALVDFIDGDINRPIIAGQLQLRFYASRLHGGARAPHSGSGSALVHLISSRHTLERTLLTPGRRISLSIKNCDSDFKSRATTLIT